MSHKIDLVGQRFGKLVVLENLGSNKHRKLTFLCKCDCGSETIVVGQDLRRGKTTSCGGEKHGMSKTRLYRIWNGMKNRCAIQTQSSYRYYGERGIKVCKEWADSFVEFYNWSISNGYKENLTIDRINVNGNYEPSNCRWIPFNEQSANRRCCISKGE